MRKRTQANQGPFSERATIMVANRQLRDVTQEAVDALCAQNDPPKIYSRDQGVVRIECVKGKHMIQPIGTVEMRNELSHAADWTTLDSKGSTKQGGLTKDLAENVLAERGLPNSFPSLVGLASSPFMDIHGNIVTTAGYDPRSRWFLGDPGPLTEWDGDGPSAAAWVLEELFGDFHFADVGSKANALALFLLPFVRAAIEGPTPMHFVDAPSPGSGKGLLVSAALLPGLGFDPPASPLPTDEPELAKTLFSMLKEGAQVIFFDNVRSLVQSPALEACLTARVYKARVLNMSSTPEVRVEAIFALAANNARFSGDAARRLAWIRLDTEEENPEGRTDFKHPQLREWAVENRALLVSAALAMCRAWVEAGRPNGKRQKGSYEQWAKTIGGILQVCGVEGFLDNDKDLKSSLSEEDGEWREFYESWWDRFGEKQVTIKELRSMAEQAELLTGAFGSSANERARSIAFGKNVRAHMGRVLNQLKYETMPPRDGNPSYKMRPLAGRAPSPVTPSRLFSPETEEF